MQAQHSFCFGLDYTPQYWLTTRLLCQHFARKSHCHLGGMHLLFFFFFFLNLPCSIFLHVDISFSEFVLFQDLDLPLFSADISKIMRTILVERDNYESRMKAAEEIQRRASSKGHWPRVLIFPEGVGVCWWGWV